MDARMINAFLESTKDVIETMAFTEISPEKPKLKEDTKTWGEVTGIIGMAGTKVSGNMAISFDAPSILSIVSKMLGEDFTVINEEITDAVGEITNMVCGGAKKRLTEQGYTFEMATPIVLKGKSLHMSGVADQPVIVIPFTTDAGRFVIEASLVPKR